MQRHRHHPHCRVTTTTAYLDSSARPPSATSSPPLPSPVSPLTPLSPHNKHHQLRRLYARAHALADTNDSLSLYPVSCVFYVLSACARRLDKTFTEFVTHGHTAALQTHPHRNFSILSGTRSRYLASRLLASGLMPFLRLVTSHEAPRLSGHTKAQACRRPTHCGSLDGPDQPKSQRCLLHPLCDCHAISH